jgi:hypothetical protein
MLAHKIGEARLFLEVGRRGAAETRQFLASGL